MPRPTTSRRRGSPTVWRFQVAESRDVLDGLIAALRKTLVRSFALLGLGLAALAAARRQPVRQVPLGACLAAAAFPLWLATSVAPLPIA